MRIISTTDLSREGNDCYIYKSISLMEQSDVYIIVSFYNADGYLEQPKLELLNCTYNIKEAVKTYKFYGGVLE